MGDLARRFGLGAEMISGVLSERVGSQEGAAIRGRMEAAVIYTQAYLTRIKAQLRWARGQACGLCVRGMHGMRPSVHLLDCPTHGLPAHPRIRPPCLPAGALCVGLCPQ